MRNDILDPTPHAAVITIRPMQNSSLFPGLQSMMRRMRARTEHFARVKVEIKKMVDATRH
jgi:hypothetical protein